MKILIIEDREQVVSAVISQAEKMGMEAYAFRPFSIEKSEIKEELSELCTEKKFDFALLDFQLWSVLNGDELAPTLIKNKVPFAAFSSTKFGKDKLVEAGAISTIPKIYDPFNRVDKKGIATGLENFLAQLT